ncbi:hypothetical protein KGP36_03165 [Patescibacteria group bacterium]|nr:hypothetical protein [Patescibacteria group bacterium]
MSRSSHLQRYFGITEEQYDELLEKQGGCCAICDRHHSEFKTRLAVDHDHSTLRIRGLLCNYCNRYRVGRHRDASLLRRIADYIEQGTDWYVPANRKKRRPRKKKNE